MHLYSNSDPYALTHKLTLTCIHRHSYIHTHHHALSFVRLASPFLREVLPEYLHSRGPSLHSHTPAPCYLTTDHSRQGLRPLSQRLSDSEKPQAGPGLASGLESQCLVLLPHLHCKPRHSLGKALLNLFHSCSPSPRPGLEYSRYSRNTWGSEGMHEWEGPQVG